MKRKEPYCVDLVPRSAASFRSASWRAQPRAQSPAGSSHFPSLPLTGILLEYWHSGDLGYPRMRHPVRQLVCQIGVHQAEDQFMLLRSRHGKAGTESPPFHCHARRQANCAGDALISSFANWNALDDVKYSIAHFIWDAIALPKAKRCVHWVWLHG
jgi:hypothetical protein